MENVLFESIVRTCCGTDTDDIHSGKAEGNFWAENELFEQVLMEANIQVKPAHELEIKPSFLHIV